MALKDTVQLKHNTIKQKRNKTKNENTNKKSNNTDRIKTLYITIKHNNKTSYIKNGICLFKNLLPFQHSHFSDARHLQPFIGAVLCLKTALVLGNRNSRYS